MLRARSGVSVKALCRFSANAVFMTSLVAGALHASPASATLGASYVSVETDRAHMSAHHAIASQAAYTVALPHDVERQCLARIHPARRKGLRGRMARTGEGPTCARPLVPISTNSTPRIRPA